MRIDPSFQYLENASTGGVGSAQGQPKIPSSPVPAGASAESPATGGGDTVQLSGTLNEVQQLKAQLDQTPELRLSRVAALQQQLQQGTYSPSNEAIASALVADLLGPGGAR